MGLAFEHHRLRTHLALSLCRSPHLSSHRPPIPAHWVWGNELAYVSALQSDMRAQAITIAYNASRAHQHLESQRRQL